MFAKETKKILQKVLAVFLFVFTLSLLNAQGTYAAFTQIWRAPYDAGGTDGAFGVALDPSEASIYVTGQAANLASAQHLRYASSGPPPTLGPIISASQSSGTGIQADSNGNFYVSTVYFITAKYSSSGVLLNSITGMPAIDVMSTPAAGQFR